MLTSALISVIVTLIVVGLLLYLIGLIPMDGTIKQIIRVWSSSQSSSGYCRRLDCLGRSGSITWCDRVSLFFRLRAPVWLTSTSFP